ncbi:MAG: chemotaxis protein CheW [Deltaproteobacteria bacterium]|nr:chemotaxis protein CheW [Deltaproteobacteria bacterium]
MDTSKYKALFLQETGEHISGIEEGLLSLEKGEAGQSGIDALFRHYHSIKGMSASMGYEPLMKLAHAQEDLLDRIRGKRLSPSPLITSALFECLDKLKDMVKKAGADAPMDTDITAYISRLEAAAIMKVEGRVFDELLSIVGELFMSLSSFKELSYALRSIAYKDGVHLLGRSVNKLYMNILSARMIPIGQLTEGLPRVVRDMSVKSGKPVELKVEGADISLDRAVLENLSSPLVHAVRNAIDHGIEGPRERTRLHKPAAGTITVRACVRRDKVVIEVSDDGKGIDFAKVRAKAASIGFPEERLKTLSDREAAMLVCLPGLSTADKVTDTSGRGVGMDVVKSIIEGLGGALSIDSTPDIGTKIIMELPRTTSIIKTLSVMVSDELFLLPVSRIEKILEAEEKDVASGTFLHEGRYIPVIPLGPALGMDEETRNGRCTIVVAEGRKDIEGEAGRGEPTDARNLAGIKVDDFGDEIDAYIKPLLPPMSRLWGVSGAAIMSDGRPAFLVDIPQIISKAADPSGIRRSWQA